MVFFAQFSVIVIIVRMSVNRKGRRPWKRDVREFGLVRSNSNTFTLKNGSNVLMEITIIVENDNVIFETKDSRPTPNISLNYLKI